MNETVSQKEYFEKIIELNDRRYSEVNAEKDKALAAALIAVKEENRKTEIAAEKRFELLNELRSGVATKDEVKALEKVVDDLKTNQNTSTGKGLGLHQGWIILIGIIGLIGGIITIISKIQ